MFAGKQALLWTLLALTLAASVWVSVAEEENAEVLVAPRQTINRQTMHPNATDGAYTPPALTREKISDRPENLFTAGKPVGTEPHTEEIALAPEIPDLPYTYAGMLDEGHQITIFLSNEKKQRNYAVHSGETLDRIWRLQSIDSMQITFIHLPSKTEIFLPIGDSN